MFLFSAHCFARSDAIVQITALSFGDLVPKSGYCELDVVSSAISSPDDMCLGSQQLALYRITTDPNTTMIIRLDTADDNAQGFSFSPKARITNDLGTETLAPIAGSETWFDSGSDGVIDIYVGGTLTVTNSLSSLQSYTINFDIEFRRP